MSDLSFREFQAINQLRNDGEAFDGSKWTGSDWGNAVAGEVGELCNVIKKIHRGDEGIGANHVREEVGGVLAYLALICNHFELDLGHCAASEFNAVSRKRNSKYFLPEKTM